MSQVYTAHDLALRNECVLSIPVAGGAGMRQVKFQFPPKILSDNRRGSWNETERRGTEPIAVFETSGAREITLTWTYIIDGGRFSPSIVSDEIHLVRGYFANVRDRDASQRNLVCFFKYILYGGREAWSARIKSVDVKHGDTIVTSSAGVGPQGGNAVAASFPLRTDITVDLRLWTKGGAGEKVQDLDKLKPQEVFEWY